ncbi:uncharacterized protein LOC126839591 isoform X2 [Adelges cooleyi]|uniref:uncharacterized protein LOC126839591 isoform X2 n=1 Tax=Adelges cooleyi TaxID=133065 RepID=UPI002180626C|nr:uncharacterized protein LOC126839591 isoform X2 [Adelges cooleyi]
MDSKKIITMTIVSLIILIAITAVYGRPSQEEDDKEKQRISHAVRDSDNFSYSSLVGHVWDKQVKRKSKPGKSGENSECTSCEQPIKLV